MCIFAQQLQTILLKRQKNLGSLFNVRVPSQPDERISPEKIQRLKKALLGDHKKSTTLNPIEIEAIQQTYAFTANEIAWLRAALAGEFIFRYLLDRLGDEVKALVAGDSLFHLLFDENDENVRARRQVILDSLRDPDEDQEEEVESTLEQKVNLDLEPLIELYEEALLCLEAARATRNPFIRQGYEAMALSLLTNAEDLVNSPSDLVDGTPEQAAWQELIAFELKELQDA